MAEGTRGTLRISKIHKERFNPQPFASYPFIPKAADHLMTGER